MNSNRLYMFLSEVLLSHSFQMYIHILTEPYISLLTDLPRAVRETSEVFLDGEKKSLNDYAVRRLWEAGYRSLWYVNRLHVKTVVIGSRPDYIVVGTSNLTERSFTNYELILVIERPERSLYEEVERLLLEPARRARYLPEVLVSLEDRRYGPALPLVHASPGGQAPRTLLEKPLRPGSLVP